MERNDPTTDHTTDRATEKSITIAIGIAIAGIIMAAVGVIFVDNYLAVAISAAALCVALVFFCVAIIKCEYTNTMMKILVIVAIIFIAIAIGIILFMKRHKSDISNEELDLSTITEHPPAFDIPIIIDMSSHSTHEGSQTSIPAEQESRAVIRISKSSFMECLRVSSQGEIRGAYYQRYKGDEEQQMFAVVEGASDYQKSDEGNLYGTIWYVDKYGAKEIDSDAKEYIWPYLYFLDDSNGKVYLTFGQYHPEGNIIYVLGVDETGPYQPVISGIGSDLRVNEYGEIEITTISKKSFVSEESAAYYFCVEGAFKEYGGIKISVSELLSIPDTNIQSIVSSLYSNECQIDTILYRENGIININFSKEYEAKGIKHYRMTIRYDGEQAHVVPGETGESYSEGTYLEALIPSIATYPTEFPY